MHLFIAEQMIRQYQDLSDVVESYEFSSQAEEYKEQIVESLRDICSDLSYTRPTLVPRMGPIQPKFEFPDLTKFFLTPSLSEKYNQSLKKIFNKKGELVKVIERPEYRYTNFRKTIKKSKAKSFKEFCRLPKLERLSLKANYNNYYLEKGGINIELRMDLARCDYLPSKDPEYKPLQYNEAQDPACIFEKSAAFYINVETGKREFHNYPLWKHAIDESLKMYWDLQFIDPQASSTLGFVHLPLL
jgi:hypothetical protein